ncbi:cobalamin-dependent protein [Actinoplanes sp. NPDC048796]|uniref:cobalamin B12-binding domain-containing protein n=1 Tax=unclassified Actinoplanes TaxID=2626549 RepID=UPI0033E21FCF
MRIPTQVESGRMTDVEKLPGPPRVVVTGLASDSHTWNLVYLQLLIEELGYEVVNLGPCVPDAVLIEQCRRLAPAMVVMSSVNGHGHTDALRVIRGLRECPGLSTTPVVIGGKLSVSTDRVDALSAELVAAGFDAVFADDGIDSFQSFVALAAGTATSAIEATA